MQKVAVKRAWLTAVLKELEAIEELERDHKAKESLERFLRDIDPLRPRWPL